MRPLEYRLEMLHDSHISRPTYRTFSDEVSRTRLNPNLFASKVTSKRRKMPAMTRYRLQYAKFVPIQLRGPFENVTSEASFAFASSPSQRSGINASGSGYTAGERSTQRNHWLTTVCDPVSITGIGWAT